ncbi:LCP family protein [Phosphitispora sp. TUW77]|uniref:LCP family protein n=1 Tax=Phosphitispora sp. TUW77 TaxID=3152361 RepID=UPI003AB5F8BD
MQRKFQRLPIIVSGIFVSTIMAILAVFFLHAGGTGAAFFKDPPEEAVVKVPPEEGHWLKTEDDKWYIPAIQKTKAREPNSNSTAFQYKPTPLAELGEVRASTVIRLEAAQTALNRLADTINIMYIWSDEDMLKVVSVMTFNRQTKQASIVVIPLYTVTNNSGNVKLNGEFSTINDLYRETGREGIRRFLEKKLDLRIRNYIHVNQTALKKISDIIGAIELEGRTSSMMEALEPVALGITCDDRDMVRAVAAEIVHPRILVRVPELLKIFTQDIKTNFTTGEMLGVFYLSRQMELQDMRKTTLPGYNYESSELKYLFVSEQIWKNIIYQMTQ